MDNESQDWADKKAQDICKHILAHELREARKLGQDDSVLLTLKPAKREGFLEGLAWALARTYTHSTCDTLRFALHEEIKRIKNGGDIV